MEEDFQTKFMLLSLEDLQDCYEKLLESYRQLRNDTEADKQLIHELKRNLETAYAAEKYLSQEIEELLQTLASIEKENKEQIKVQAELEDLRRKHHTLTIDYTLLQQDNAALRAEIVKMCKQSEAVKSAKKLSTSTIVNAGTEELAKRIASLEEENFSLMQKLEKFQESLRQQTLALAERESNIEVLRGQVTCLEENLHIKCENLYEKTMLLESAEAHLAEYNAKLVQLETKPEGLERKCNSLFTEVYNHRKDMTQLLCAQEKRKAKCNNSQSEIRRLKHQKSSTHTGIKQCTSIFCSVNRKYQDKLNDRIHQIHRYVEGLEKNLKAFQISQRDFVSDKVDGWLDSVLSFCKYALPVKVVNYVTSFTTEALKIFRYSRKFFIVEMGMTF